MGRLRNIIAGGAAALTIFGMFKGPSIWEHYQPKIELTARVLEIEPYYGRNELYMYTLGVVVVVADDPRPINFPADKWDSSIEKGDNITAVVRRSWPWFGLYDGWDGLEVK